ncbi:LOW QUALITY PROTEIN: cation channel sperm-associated auxiliary subunit epsilon [Gymnogyps californianus]|uniref:LOW QUALITY PROTEIN: cation channel sperm-associated auxiliary subunit epsilon n=1 Tax=Gymnogyps californianus TaxID=33616 RepID=UPI0021CADF79|nr:LOW QUALITY PROTEIN: cation channel sperm-associated auxiliary subunit epsilon [Gymnogyps californianus]
MQTDPLSISESQKLILWIYDPESADASELNHTAIIPSQGSQIFGRLFWNLGQEPVVHTYLKKEKYYSQEHSKLGTFYKREASNFFKLGVEHKLPESEITGIHSRYWCSSVCPVQSGKQLGTLAAWTSSEVYLGYNETFTKIGDRAHLVKFLNFPNAASLSIEAVSYDSVPSEITLLLICSGCSSSKLFFLAVYNEDRQFWGLRNFYVPVPRSSVMRMIYISAALSSGLLWDDVSFTTLTKTTQLMDIFKYLDQNFLYHQKCLMGALFTRLFLVSYCYVGCPPGRHIVVERYDGDSYVRNVEANFILWEMKGRTDYGYTSFMKENYRSCFVFHQNSTNEGLHEQYQILNSTSNNDIVWATSHSAIYVFRVKILDQNDTLLSFF